MKTGVFNQLVDQELASEKNFLLLAMFSTVADFSTAFAGAAAQVPAAAGAAAQVSATPNVPFADGAAGGGAAAVDALTGVLGHGGGHSQTKQTKLGKLITDFLCNNNCKIKNHKFSFGQEKCVSESKPSR